MKKKTLLLALLVALLSFSLTMGVAYAAVPELVATQGFD